MEAHCRLQGPMLNYVSARSIHRPEGPAARWRSCWSSALRGPWSCSWRGLGITVDAQASLSKAGRSMNPWCWQSIDCRGSQ